MRQTLGAAQRTGRQKKQRQSRPIWAATWTARVAGRALSAEFSAAAVDQISLGKSGSFVACGWLPYGYISAHACAYCGPVPIQATVPTDSAAV